MEGNIAKKCLNWFLRFEIMPFTFVQGFFRRSIVKVQQNKESYKCVGKGEGCILGPGKRNPCAACRYARCLDVGMSIGGTYVVFVDWLFCFTPYRQFSIHKTAACVWGQMYLLYVTFTWLLILSIVPSYVSDSWIISPEIRNKWCHIPIFSGNLMSGI